MSLLEVRDLRAHIALRDRVVRAVDGVSLYIEKGETLGLVGESGSGKSMTAFSIMKLLPPGGHIVGGSVRLDGMDLVPMSDAQIRSVRGSIIGMVFQDPMTSLNPTMSIGRQIAESVVLHRGANKAEAMKRAAEVLELVGIPKPSERLDDFPHQLSGGLRQRVMIAMALACEPKLLIADEPTTALDVTIQAQILALLDDLKTRLGMAILLITHDMGVIAGHADRTMVMYAGKVVESASTEELFVGVRHPYTEALLASIPQLDQDKSQKLYAIPGLPPDLSRPLTACRFSPRCRYARDKCTLEEPLLGEGTSHPYACFYPVGRSASEIAGRGDLVVAAGAPGDVGAGRGLETGTRLASHAGCTLGGPVHDDARRSERRAEVQEGGNVVPGAGLANVIRVGISASELEASAPVEAVTLSVPAEVLLELRGVRKEYPVTAGAVLQRRVGTVQAVRGVDLSVSRGETLGVVGESGCGKSTLGRMIVGLERPTAGEVFFEGVDLAKLGGAALRRAHRDLALMFQDPYASLDPRMRVGSIIREPLAVHGASRAEQEKRTAALLDEVGLPRQAVDLYPHEFSGGQRQRIGLARALALNPRLIVTDEPVSALDVSIRSQILNLMKRLQLHHGLSYVFISHDLSVVRYVADRIAVMYLGKLVEVGTGDDIYSNAAHPYTAGLIGSIPVPNPVVQRSREKIAISGELPSPLNPPSGCPFRTRCPKAQERCAEEEPLLASFGGQHMAACHFPLHHPVSATVAVGTSRALS